MLLSQFLVFDFMGIGKSMIGAVHAPLGKENSHSNS